MAYKLKKGKTLKRKSNKKQKHSKKTLKNKNMTRKTRRRSKKTLKNKNVTRKTNKKQYGGNFNAVEIDQIKEALQNMNFFTDAEINEMIEKINLSSQVHAGEYFEQLIYQIHPGNFTDKQDFMDWFNAEYLNQEDKVATDREHHDDHDFTSPTSGTMNNDITSDNDNTDNNNTGDNNNTDDNDNTDDNNTDNDNTGET